MFESRSIWFGQPLPQDYEYKVLYDEMMKELSGLTLRSGLKALTHDDAVDLLNQMGQMQIRVPSYEDDFIDIGQNYGGFELMSNNVSAGRIYC
jgi:hypothetical protein